ncbi:4'-phosphopantetheinyl transferase superfamily protein [Actinokineospora sp. NBRC 105648]|uniref:4'-phosphopantetheinyl transferase family protein n=1 Tax=Actinokineospora sp. NBRC 105648 TaxID=3032206 RepID=UPI0024A04E0B|nr:4'-phosphopantetheinyl transferase superfamily protein [Actinokineospora sp. NBRC 105648]GLZ39772.1 hypothetical protein Acsp05_33960 [Actinokineospora sp. NBRC 105648]
MSPDTVRVWLVDSALPAPELDRLAATLDPGERAKAAEMGARQRREYIAAHGAARAIVGRALGIEPARVRWTIGRHGKPEVDGLRMSLTRSFGLAMVACADRRAVGVDLQWVDDGLDIPRAATRFYPADEARHVGGSPARFTGLLARKEACVKAAGGRLFPGLRLPVHDRTVVWQADGPYRVRDIPAPRGYLAAVALAGTEDFEVREHRWCGLEEVAPW